MTFPKVLEDCPSHANFGQAMTTVYAEGLKVGYRYFDRPGNPSSQFPFGYVSFSHLRDQPLTFALMCRSHGLSYTSFAYSEMRLESTAGFGVDVSFTIKNTGDRSGAEAAQVYVHSLNSRVERPDVELKGFGKVSLEPGQSKRITVNLDVSQLEGFLCLVAVSEQSSASSASSFLLLRCSKAGMGGRSWLL